MLDNLGHTIFLEHEAQRLKKDSLIDYLQPL
ncbi:hypothetical protein CP8484711_1996A, partial [Chlamydia psittaci 84-8471/1]